MCCDISPYQFRYHLFSEGSICVGCFQNSPKRSIAWCTCGLHLCVRSVTGKAWCRIHDCTSWAFHRHLDNFFARSVRGVSATLTVTESSMLVVFVMSSSDLKLEAFLRKTTVMLFQNERSSHRRTTGGQSVFETFSSLARVAVGR